MQCSEENLIWRNEKPTSESIAIHGRMTAADHVHRHFKKFAVIEEELFHEKRLFVLVWNLIAYIASLRRDFFISSFFIAEHQNKRIMR